MSITEVLYVISSHGGEIQGEGTSDIAATKQ